MSSLYGTPIATLVESLQNDGREVYIRGFSHDGSRALVVDNDHQVVSVASIESYGTLGRWECSTTHLGAYGEIYSGRFPRQD